MRMKGSGRLMKEPRSGRVDPSRGMPRFCARGSCVGITCRSVSFRYRGNGHSSSVPGRGHAVIPGSSSPAG